ncbi:cytochrome P450 [Artemisia annua]|uniref:Cytochrome P450 n=1 Tax=Artemisia annua TaxID=35608 RepID=A0A2U1K8V1_ARTAN|nr:cytochrome P450 [Artemisia annua]
MAKLIINHESWVWEVVSNNEPTVLMAVVTTSVLILAGLWYKLTLSSSSPPLPPGPRELPIVGYLPFLGRDLHKQFTTIVALTHHLYYGPSICCSISSILVE